MSDDRKDLPPVTSPNFLEKVRESLSTYLGNRGNLLDRGITLRDLTDSGIVTLRPGFLSTGRGSPIGGAGSSVAGVYEPDLTPPPTPTGFVATAAISNLLVECDAQTYRQGHGHAKSVLYGASWAPAIAPAVDPPLPVFTDAVVLTEFGGTVASHATNPSTTWHLWLKWVTVDGVASTVPAGGTNGVVTRTGEDVDLLVKAMTGPGNPFTILTEETVIDGVTYPAGTYTTLAFIMDAQISRAKIKDLAVDNAKIADLSVAKLTAGTLDVGVHIQSTALHSDGTPKWKIDGDGLATLNNAVVRGTVYATDGKFTGEVEALGAGGAGGDKARMYYGNFEVYRTVPGVGQVLYKALSRSESGVGANNVPVTIPGYFRTQPRVIVSPASLQLYAAAYAGQNQSITVQADSILESSPGSMVWSFTPVATLNLAANAGSAVINQSSGTLSTAWTSSEYTTPANTASISPSVTLASNRGNGTSQYFYRTVRWKVQYFNGSSWVDGPYTTTNLAADTGASTVSTATFNFPGTGAWKFRIYCEAYDTNGAVFGAVSYNYVTDTFSRVATQGAETSLGNYSFTYSSGYSIPAGWERSSDYSVTAQVQYRLGNTAYAALTIHMGGSNYFFAPTTGGGWVTQARSFADDTSTLSISGSSSGNGAISSCNILSISGSVQRRQAVANSTTAQNSFQFNSYGYTLTSAQVLATGSLNWVAIGD